MPLGANPCHLSTWNPVISNFRARLGSWKGKLLSVAGRIFLIKAVMNSIPSCCMFVFFIAHGGTSFYLSYDQKVFVRGVGVRIGIKFARWLGTRQSVKKKPW